jgi:hypothetical protein
MLDTKNPLCIGSLRDNGTNNGRTTVEIRMHTG